MDNLGVNNTCPVWLMHIVSPSSLSPLPVHEGMKKLCHHCRDDSIAQSLQSVDSVIGWRDVQPMGSPMSHSTKLGFSLFVEGWGEVWSLHEDFCPTIGIRGAWGPGWDCSAR